MAIQVDPIPEYAVLRPLLWNNYERANAARLRYWVGLEKRLADQYPGGVTEDDFQAELRAGVKIEAMAERLWEAMEWLWTGKESRLQAMIVLLEH